MNPPEDFFYLCRLFGVCQKRTQGTGGNISCKYEDKLIVKASGYRLSSVNPNDGFVVCNRDAIIEKYRNQDENLEDTVIRGSPRKPSMETFFHLLAPSHIVHIHPTHFCKYLCQKNAASIFSSKNFPNSMFVQYIKPGIHLAKHLLSVYSGESIIFLESHGIILLGNSSEEIIHIYNHAEFILKSITYENMQISSIVVEQQIYRLTNQLAKPIYDLSYRLPNAFKAITPDHFLFLKEQPIQTSRDNLEEVLSQETHEIPSILQVDSIVYAIGNSYIQCQNKEEYLRSYFDIYDNSITLSVKDTVELSTCPKEIFRLAKK